MGVMDEWVKNSDRGAVKTLSCPDCGQLIGCCNRYKNQMKIFYHDISSIQAQYKKNSVPKPSLRRIRMELADFTKPIGNLNLKDEINSLLSQTVQTTGRKLSRDEFWDQYQRCVLVYQFAVLMKDFNKTYSFTCEKDGGIVSESMELISDEAARLRQLCLRALRTVTGRPNLMTARQMFDACRRLDCFRQLYVIQAIREKLPASPISRSLVISWRVLPNGPSWIPLLKIPRRKLSISLPNCKSISKALPTNNSWS